MSSIRVLLIVPFAVLCNSQEPRYRYKSHRLVCHLTSTWSFWCIIINIMIIYNKYVLFCSVTAIIWISQNLSTLLMCYWPNNRILCSHFSVKFSANRIQFFICKLSVNLFFTQISHYYADSKHRIFSHVYDIYKCPLLKCVNVHQNAKQNAFLSIYCRQKFCQNQ